MTKHTGSYIDEAVTVVAASAPVGLHFSPFPLSNGTSHDCKKLTTVHVHCTADGGGSWFESMKASSPRHVAVADADAEHDNWMVLLLHGPHQLPTSSPFSMVRLINS
jgi:trehalose 6-phosphate phosphatase